MESVGGIVVETESTLCSHTGTGFQQEQHSFPYASGGRAQFIQYYT